MRGTALGLLSAALAVAAHGLGGGGFPDSTALMLLFSVAVVAGTLAAALPPPGRITGRAGLLAALAGGQWMGHEVLTGLIGHQHAMIHAATSRVTAAGSPFPLPMSGHAMLIVHAVAVPLCALLLVAAERLYAVVSRAIRAVTERPRPIFRVAGPARRPGDHLELPRFLHLGAIAARAPPVPA
ncbi:hypothetical protein [Nocardia sp. alder85J]|uniref:hypothetical protein n=1 Tax=Nocardia sp. alder85J TaxID=2862949 RepID=UPI001CD5B129|nr:hypothetical protein [Nocardia sp. alder85J]MCX4096583.1 hypothetical protein [Nocardia sp. alder85J]